MRIIKYSEELADVINKYLIDDDWRFTFDRELGCFFFDLSLDGKIKRVFYFIDIRETNYIVYAISPIGVEKDDREVMDEMTKYIGYVNYQILNGNLEINQKEGEIRYKVFMDCEGTMPTKQMFHNSIYIPAMVFDRFSSGMADIIFSGITAKEAFTKIVQKSEGNEQTFEEENPCSDDMVEIDDEDLSE